MKRRRLHKLTASLLTIAAVMMCAFPAFAETGSPVIPPIPGSGTVQATADTGTEITADTATETETTADTRTETEAAAESTEIETAEESAENSVTGPASECKDSDGTSSKVTGTKGKYLGEFSTTAYCNCSTCCTGGFTLTYAGTVPKANHTISADISRYPIGTKLMIGDIIYTVEDIGSNVSGNCLDIYFDTHQQALDYGRKTVDVYAVE